MKNFTFLLISLVVLISCKKEEDPFKGETCIKAEESYSNDNGTELNLTLQEWYLEENNIGYGGVNVGVAITGRIVGDSATILTKGDGLIGEPKITLNKKKGFNQQFEIFFTSSPSTVQYISGSTVIRVFNGPDTLKVEIDGCPLKNIHYQSED